MKIGIDTVDSHIKEVANKIDEVIFNMIRKVVFDREGKEFDTVRDLVDHLKYNGLYALDKEYRPEDSRGRYTVRVEGRVRAEVLFKTEFDKTNFRYDFTMSQPVYYDERGREICEHDWVYLGGHYNVCWFYCRKCGDRLTETLPTVIESEKLEYIRKRTGFGGSNE